MMRFRKKPVVIEAVQLTNEILDAPHPCDDHLPGLVYDPKERCAFIETLEGTMRAEVGDWIIIGVKGEKYPCKPDVFEATYEPWKSLCDIRVDEDTGKEDCWYCTTHGLTWIARPGWMPIPGSAVCPEGARELV